MAGESYHIAGWLILTAAFVLGLVGGGVHLRRRWRGRKRATDEAEHQAEHQAERLRAQLGLTYEERQESAAQDDQTQRPALKPWRFPPPWSVEEREESFFVRDATDQPLACVYFEDEAIPERRMTKRPTKDEARRIALSIAKLPDLLGADL